MKRIAILIIFLMSFNLFAGDLSIQMMSGYGMDRYYKHIKTLLKNLPEEITKQKDFLAFNIAVSHNSYFDLENDSLFKEGCEVYGGGNCLRYRIYKAGLKGEEEVRKEAYKILEETGGKEGYILAGMLSLEIGFIEVAEEIINKGAEIYKGDSHDLLRTRLFIEVLKPIHDPEKIADAWGYLIQDYGGVYPYYVTITGKLVDFIVESKIIMPDKFYSNINKYLSLMQKNNMLYQVRYIAQSFKGTDIENRINKEFYKITKETAGENPKQSIGSFELSTLYGSKYFNAKVRKSSYPSILNFCNNNLSNSHISLLCITLLDREDLIPLKKYTKNIKYKSIIELEALSFTVHTLTSDYKKQLTSTKADLNDKNAQKVFMMILAKIKDLRPDNLEGFIDTIDTTEFDDELMYNYAILNMLTENRKYMDKGFQITKDLYEKNKNPEYLFLLGEYSYLALKDYETALDYYNKYSKEYGGIGGYIRSAEIFKLKGDNEKSQALLHKAGGHKYYWEIQKHLAHIN